MWLHMIFNEKFAPLLVEMFEEALPGKHVYAMFASPKKVTMPVDFLIIRNKRANHRRNQAARLQS